MNFLKRGLQSLWAKKGRSLLLIAVFSAILIFVLAGLTIRSAALVATENAQKSVGATVTLQANREQAFQQRSSSSDSDDQSTRPDPGSFQSTPVAITDAQAIADLDGVASYSFEVSTSADAVSGIEPISSSDSSTESEATDSSESGQMGGNRGGSFPSFTQSAEVESLEITVSPQQIGLLALLGLGISFGSILLSSAGILRLNPKKILVS